MDELQNGTIIGGILIGLITISLVIVSTIWIVYYYKIKLTARDFKLKDKELKLRHEMVELEVKSQEIVRERISGDLHDTMGSTLFGAKLSGLVLLNRLEPDSENHILVKEIIDCLNRSMENAREIALEIAPSSFTTKGLSRCVQEFCSKMKGKQLRIIVEEKGKSFLWNSERALQAFRILQELLYNSSKHSGTETVIIEIDWREREIELKVIDFGIGLNNNRSTNGLGLWNIQIRIRHLQGNFVIVKNYKKSGTTAIATIPY